MGGDVSNVLDSGDLSDRTTATATTTTTSCEYDEHMQRVYYQVSWWSEYVLQTAVGVAGLVANTLAIPILCSKEMSSIFNRLLVFLSLFDSLYIICSILEGKRHDEELREDGFDQLHEYAFGYFLYQLHNFTLCCSIYVTVALALERYRAVWKPVEYHNMCKGVNLWRRVLSSYVLPVVVFSILFNIPKCFEIEFKERQQVVVLDGDVRNSSTGTGTGTSSSSNSNNRTMVVSQYVTVPSALRLDHTYVILYANIARLLVQGIVPFTCLSFLNYRIYTVMKGRRHLLGRPPPAGSGVAARRAMQQQQQQQAANVGPVRSGGGIRTGRASSSSSAGVSTKSKSPMAAAAAQRRANEAQQAIVLLMIVLLFFICHTLRFVLNIHEFLNLDLLKKSINNDCNGISIWALGLAKISHLLMTLNSSINFYIYCFMCSTFRSNLRNWFLRAAAAAPAAAAQPLLLLCSCCRRTSTLDAITMTTATVTAAAAATGTGSNILPRNNVARAQQDRFSRDSTVDLEAALAGFPGEEVLAADQLAGRSPLTDDPEAPVESFEVNEVRVDVAAAMQMEMAEVNK